MLRAEYLPDSASAPRARIEESLPKEEAASLVDVQIVSTSAITPYARNPRRGQAVAKVKASLQEFGFRQPIVVDAQQVIVAGHARYFAALELGLDKVPVHVAEGLSKAQIKAYRLADNRTAQAEWDNELLALELEDLRASNFDLALTGFEEAELDGLLEEPFTATDHDAEPQMDRAEELQAKWQVKRGDLFAVGAHRLLCADSTDVEAVEYLMNGAKARLFATDPPYGVNYVKTKAGIPRSGYASLAEDYSDIDADDFQDEKLQAFLESCFGLWKDHLENAGWYLWHAHLTQGYFAAAAAAAADVIIHRQIIWVKSGFNLTRSGMYHWAHEPCFFGWRKGQQCAWYGEKNQRSVWEIDRREGKGLHPTQKPWELWKAPIQNHTLPGEICAEPFAGSGSQFIAGENLGRRVYGMEVAPKYCSVILQRMSEAFPALEITRL